MSRELELLANLAEVQEEIPSNVTLVVVTKTYPISDIEILYKAGVRNFGENRDQEGASKAPQLPGDALWHFQGQIQSNKLNSITSWAHYIDSLDDLSHARKINKLVQNPKEVFLQVSLDGEVGRGGILPEEISEFMDELSKLRMIKPIGLMAIAPLSANPESAFNRLAEIKSAITSEFPEIKYLSAGMSGDFKIAIKYGATHVRIGSSILGSRT